MDARSRLLRHFARDLCTRTEGEIRALWKGPEIDALNKIERGVFEKFVTLHNPVYYLAQKVWFDNDPELLWEPLHKGELCRAFLDYYFYEPKEKGKALERIAGLLILIQRDSFKSTFNHGVFPQWVSLREKVVNDRDIRVLMLHHREEQASLNLQRLKSKSIQSKFFKDTFPEFSSELDFGTKTKFDWPCKKDGIFSEPSVFAAGLGARMTGLHFDWSFNDDLVTDEDRTSKLIRDSSLFKYRTSRYMLDTKSGKEVNTGTRYHINDLWAKLEASQHASGKKMYSFLHIQAGGAGTDFSLSYPNRHTQDFLDQRRRQEVATSGNDILWWLQYQNLARADRLMATDRGWLRFVEMKELRADMARVILVDPAWKGSKNAGTGDDAAIAVIGFEKRGFLTMTYLLDLIVSDLMTSLDGENAIFQLMKQWGVTDVAVEEFAGHTFRTDLENEAASRGVYINLVDLKSKQTSKQERIMTFLRRVQAGQFHILNSCRQQDVFLGQYDDFPQNIDEKNDAIDVVAYSADEAIATLFAPRWNTEALGDEWMPPPPEHTRTRYCLT